MDDLPDQRRYEFEQVAQKSTTTAILLGVLLSPIGYWYVGKKFLALINLLTLNFLFLGIVIVPIHAWKVIKDARAELERYGHEVPR